MSSTLLRPGNEASEPTVKLASYVSRPTATHSGQVFVDDSGRRRRIVRRVAAAVGVGAVLYVAAVLGALGDSSVRPGVELSHDVGNGEVAGFPQDPGVPGLLSEGPGATSTSKARPVSTSRAKPTTTAKPKAPATATATSKPKSSATSSAPSTSTKPKSTTTSAPSSTNRPVSAESEPSTTGSATEPS